MNTALELIVGILLAALAVYVVLRPILAPEAPAPRDGGTEAADEGEDPEDDLSARTVALRALKEIEFDRATGKLTDADYEALKRRYTAEALAALRQEPESLEPAARPTPTIPASACPTHGVRPERDARYCSVCGRRLGSAPGFCSRCGTALEPDARFCARCGGRIAA